MSGQFGEIGLYFIFLKIQWNSSHNGMVHKDAEVSNGCQLAFTFDDLCPNVEVAGKSEPVFANVCQNSSTYDNHT